MELSKHWQQLSSIAADLLVDDGSDRTISSTTSCTLRSAIMSINSAQNTDGCIADGLFGINDSINFSVTNISGLESTLEITSDVRINPNGSLVRISSLGNGSVFEIRDTVVSIDDVVITGGSAFRDGGGIYARDSTVTLSNVSVVGNRADDDGGGIFLRDSSLTLTGSTVSANTVSDDGGGVYSRTSTTSISNSTISSNSADDEGGGLNFHITSSATITNSTISSNTAGDEGGGVDANFNSSVSITNSTVSNNSSDRVAGGISFTSGELVSRNNLITGNFAGSDVLAFSEISLSVGATVNFIGTNLIGDDSKTKFEALNFTPSNNVILSTSDGNQPTRLSSILSPLADNGGFTLTHALPIGSPAIDAGNANICAAGPVNKLDQRGFSRSDLCDIGAYEFDPALPTDNPEPNNPIPDDPVPYNPVPPLYLLLLDHRRLEQSLF